MKVVEKNNTCIYSITILKIFYWLMDFNLALEAGERNITSYVIFWISRDMEEHVLANVYKCKCAIFTR